MRDIFPIGPPQTLVNLAKPLVVDTLGLSTLPFHIHEISLSVAFYTWIYYSVSPRVSRHLFPKAYASFNTRTRLNWDVHVVAFVQSLIICAFAIYIILCDPDRRDSSWADRIWGYSPLTGLCQAMAGGYFIWDLVVCVKHIDLFGVGMLVHAICALCVFALGFRPLFTYYGPIFLIYEVSSPFNNIHWFLDKLDLTGSYIQWINGIVLIATFFCCRLVWGAWHTAVLLFDIWSARQHGLVTLRLNDHQASTVRNPGAKFAYYASSAAGLPITDAQRETMMSGQGKERVPLWIASAFLVSNVSLYMLNVYWINKMVATVRRRFPPPFGTKGVGGGVDVAGREKKSRSDKKTL